MPRGDLFQEGARPAGPYPKERGVSNPFVSCPRTKSEENAFQVLPQAKPINHTCHCAPPALPRTFWKCVMFSWTLSLPISSYLSLRCPSYHLHFCRGLSSIFSQNLAPFCALNELGLKWSKFRGVSRVPGGWGSVRISGKVPVQWLFLSQGAAGGEHPPRGQHRLPGGGEVSENTASGGARARPSVQAVSPQRHLPVHGAGLPHHRRGRAALTQGEGSGARDGKALLGGGEQWSFWLSKSCKCQSLCGENWVAGRWEWEAAWVEGLSGSDKRG